MAEFDIYVDSSANIPGEICTERGIRVIPYRCNINGAERLCVEEGVPFQEVAKKFYEDMREGMEAKTSLIAEQDIIDAVTPSLKAGRDILVITIASGISGTYRQALAAQKTLAESFPERDIAVADSANASMGEGLLALKVADLRDMGESLETCAKWLETNTYKLNSYVTVSDLKYLRRGGRISATLAIAGTLLSIKPVLKADGAKNAKLVFAGKEHGRKKALSALAKAFAENVVNPANQTVAITHADCEEDALALAETVKSLGAKDVIIEYYDLCTGAHVGPGTVALFFLGQDRRGESACASETVVLARPAVHRAK